MTNKVSSPAPVRTTDRRFVFTAIALEISLGVVALVAGRLVGTPLLATVSWSSAALAIGVVATIPPMSALAVMWRSESTPLTRIRELLESSLLRELSRLSAFELAILALAAGIGEELLFRAFLQTLLESLWGPTLGLLVASLIFGLAHPITAAYFAITTVMGIYLGLVWWAAGNLVAPVVTHALYDFLAIGWMIREKRERENSG